MGESFLTRRTILTGVDTSDADAIAGDIRTAKTAYVNGIKLTGTLTPLDTSDATAAAGDIKNSKTAYVNGAKLTGSYVPVAKGLMNYCPNGNFVNGDGWTPQQASESVSGNVYSLIGNGAVSYPYVTNNMSVSNPVSGTKIFVHGQIRIRNANCEKMRLEPCYSNTGGGTLLSGASQIDTPTVDQWYDIDAVYQFASTDAYWAYRTQMMLLAQETYYTAAQANGAILEIKNVSYIDLTESYGAGNEPTASVITALLEQITNKWFNKVTAIITNL